MTPRCRRRLSLSLCLGCVLTMYCCLRLCRFHIIPFNIVQSSEDTLKYKTRVISSNGFNPVWQETFSFHVSRPEVSLLYVAVHDAADVVAGSRSALLAYFALPLCAVRCGYRSCPLRDASGKKMPWCNLLCKFEKLPTTAATTAAASSVVA